GVQRDVAGFEGAVRVDRSDEFAPVGDEFEDAAVEAVAEEVPGAVPACDGDGELAGRGVARAAGEEAALADAEHRHALDLSAPGTPGGAIPGGGALRGHTAGVEEIAPDDEFVGVDGHAAGVGSVQAGAEGSPLGAVPARDMVGIAAGGVEGAGG